MFQCHCNLGPPSSDCASEARERGSDAATSGAALGGLGGVLEPQTPMRGPKRSKCGGFVPSCSHLCQVFVP